MKVFCAQHAGHYLGGCSVIVAKDRRTARRILKRELEAACQEIEIYGMWELDTTTEKVTTLFSGDY
jgi:hypothetical protein